MLLQSLQMLEQLLTGHQLSSVELDDLINQKAKEDLYLEYKHGNELQKSDASNTIREYLSAFANSAGGILIIGVNESEKIPTEITGCNDHGKGKLDEWASRCLTPIANYFAPPPRFQVISHSRGDVLVCVVQRSLGLVPISESGGIVYYFRLGDQTLKAPDYLLADLLLGRRQQPVFEIVKFEALNFRRVSDDLSSHMDLAFEIRFRVENSSIVWADDSKWGIIHWAHSTENVGIENGEPSQHLLSYLEVKDETFIFQKPRWLVHTRWSVPISKPFDVGEGHIKFVVPLRILNAWFSYTWKAALYFIARNSLPIWYQIEFVINKNAAQYPDKQSHLGASLEL